MRIFPAILLKEDKVHWLDFVHLLAHQQFKPRSEGRGIEYISHYFAVRFQNGHPILMPIVEDPKMLEGMQRLLPRLPPLVYPLPVKQVFDFFRVFFQIYPEVAVIQGRRWIPCPLEERTVCYEENLWRLEVVNAAEIFESNLFNGKILAFDSYGVRQSSLAADDVFLTSEEVRRQLELNGPNNPWIATLMRPTHSVPKYDANWKYLRQEKSSISKENEKIASEPSLHRRIIASLIDGCGSWGDIDHRFSNLPNAIPLQQQKDIQKSVPSSNPSFNAQDCAHQLSPTASQTTSSDSDSPNAIGTQQPIPHDRLLSNEEVMAILGHRESSFHAKFRKNPTFPLPINVSNGHPRFSERAIMEWIASQPLVHPKAKNRVKKQPGEDPNKI